MIALSARAYRVNTSLTILYVPYVVNVDCPNGMEYQTCSWNMTCDEFGVVRDCINSTCQSGCFCSNGYVLEDGVCSHPDMCTSKE